MTVRSLATCERGSMFVESLVMIPLLAVLWTIAVFLEEGNTVDNDVVEEGRYCAWRHAVDKCEGGAPGNCQVSGRSEVMAPELEMASNNALTTLVQETPYLAYEWLRPHGAIFHVRSEGTISRPFGWSTIDVSSDQTWMCQTPDSFWTHPLVFAAQCQYYGLKWCSVGGSGSSNNNNNNTSLSTSSTNSLSIAGAQARQRFIQWKIRRASGGARGISL